MKQSQILIAVFVISIVGFIFYSLQGGESAEAYAQEILKEREEKDFQMTLQDSPFSEEDKKEFKGLQYYAPNMKFRISARLSPIESKKMRILTTNDGLETRYLEYAYANFSINEIDCSLLILEVTEAGPNRGTLFLAFADETSARETYGAGRYLDINKVPGSTSILLDFNKAYNPYCAYTASYSCPFPPKENILPVAIEAGEKIYH
ncbi:MAG: DUF1684 domain-containing protein [Cyclobacteriaceae bacterium]